jgi:hypothetical protein
MPTNNIKENERRSVSYEKVSNGYIVTVSKEYKDANGEYQYEQEKHIANTAQDTQKLIEDLVE